MIANQIAQFMGNVNSVRELSAGWWFCVCVFLTLACIRFAACRFDRQRADGVWEKVPLAEWRRMAGVRLAVGLSVCLIGSGIRAGLEWALLWHLGRDLDVERWRWLADHLIPLGSILAMIGGACAIRVLSREAWGHWAWISAILISVAVPILIAIR